MAHALVIDDDAQVLELKGIDAVLAKSAGDGFDAFDRSCCLHKPFQAQQLLAAVETCLAEVPREPYRQP